MSVSKGSLALRAGHRPIVMPRLGHLGEHVDDHQLQLWQALADLDLIAPIGEGRQLDSAVVAHADAPRPRLDEVVTAPPMADEVRAWLAGGAGSA